MKNGLSIKFVDNKPSNQISSELVIISDKSTLKSAREDCAEKLRNYLNVLEVRFLFIDCLDDTSHRDTVITIVDKNGSFSYDAFTSFVDVLE